MGIGHNGDRSSISNIQIPISKSMTFEDYQNQSRKTAIYPNAGDNFIYPTLGLAGEAGEVAEKVKKILRDKNGQVDDETRATLQKELGDVLWYITQTASEMDISLEDIAQGNLDKLFKRKDEDKLHGEGDNR